MSILSADEILQADDLPREMVSVPEWGKGRCVYVRTMTATERDAFEIAELAARGKNIKANVAGLRGRLAAATICNEAGVRLFEAGHGEALGKKSAPALDRIFTVAARLNKISEKDVEELAKN